MKSLHWDKLVDDYFKQVSSPFSKGVRNPIYKNIRAIGNTLKKSVLEIGCGTGTLIPFLAKNFKRVVAVDISKKMIANASKKASRFDNVELHVMDAVNITKLKESFDVIVCVNSILMPNIVKINIILKKMNKLLKWGGHLVGIFPSFDSTIYQALITYDKEYEKRKDRKKARRATNRIITSGKHDFIYGFIYATEQNSKQKHYFEFELNYRLRKAGFLRIQISKVYYPWEDLQDPNPLRFKDKMYEKVWDWSVTARKF